MSFSYKDYRLGGLQKMMDLQGEEFLRRFCQHILLLGFRKGRHYGFIANATKAKSIKTARAALQIKHKELLRRAARMEMNKGRLWGNQSDLCPCCKKGTSTNDRNPTTSQSPSQNNSSEEGYQ